jgi:prepilin-type N-terminal cleavage/methylation domain-containing protein
MVKHKRENGFTLVELLIATAVFSLVLVVFLSAFIRISQLFYKGVTMSNTQESARNVVQDISDDLQFFQQQPVAPTGANYFCIGSHRYSWNLGVQVSSSTYGVAREQIPSSTCPSTASQPVPVGTTKYEELLDPGMQVNKLSLSSCVNGQCVISIHLVSYGSDNTVLISPSGLRPAYQANDAVCSGPATSSEFCATADYTSTVLQGF